MRTRTKVFFSRVADNLGRHPVILDENASVGEMLDRMASERADCVLIVKDGAGPDHGSLVGIVTEQDVVRRIALRSVPSDPVRAVMTIAPHSVSGDDYLYYAIAMMRRRGLRYMPVVREDGHPLGVIELHRALAIAGEIIVGEIDRLCHDRSLEGLGAVKAAQVELAVRLMEDKIPAPDILALISHINADLHLRALDAAQSALEDEGMGAPPLPFNLMIMGSGGRGENYLYPDQDNGFIIDNYPDEDHVKIDPYFIALAERFNDNLDAIGFPYCNGHVMARNPLWRKTRDQWRHQIALWEKRRTNILIRHADIFFDFRGAGPNSQWARALRRDVCEIAAGSKNLLGSMLKEAKRASVALGWFGRFTLEKEKEEHLGEINLKHRGTLPLVSHLRLLALRDGVGETGTLERLAALRKKDAISAKTHDYLAAAFHHISFLLLRQQLADFQDPNRNVSNYVHPTNLTAYEKDELGDALKAIERFADEVALELSGEIF